jgi:hypothetical protein
MRVLTFVIAIVIVATSILTGCTRRSPVLTTTEIVSRVISVMNQVKTYRLDSDVTDNYTIVGTNSNFSDIYLRQDHPLINLADNTTWFSYNISDGIGTPYIGQYYLIGRLRYGTQSSPIWYNRNGHTEGWGKTELTDQQNWIFPDITQLAPQIKILKPTSEVELLGKEKVDSHECYVLAIMPTANGATNWVLSQNKGTSGPSLYWWKTGPERSTEIYVKAYVDGSSKFWIDCDNFRIRQVNINLHFVVKPGNVKYSETGLEIGDNTSELDLPFDEIIRDFHGQLHFSDYGQRLSITPPPEALVTPVG